MEKQGLVSPRDCHPVGNDGRLVGRLPLVFVRATGDATTCSDAEDVLVDEGLSVVKVDEARARGRGDPGCAEDETDDQCGVESVVISERSRYPSPGVWA